MKYVWKEPLHIKIKMLKTLSLPLFILLGLLCIYSEASAVDPHELREPGPPIVNNQGIIFTYRNTEKKPKYVMVSGDFNNWEEPIFMQENRHGIYVYKYEKTIEKEIVLKEGLYRYRYLIDGIWVKDPHNPKTVYDQFGTELNVFEVPVPIILLNKNPVKLNHNKYLFYYKNSEARDVFILGDFNNWNPYSHRLMKNKSGIWEIEMDIPPGSYSYSFIVDGTYRKDPLSKEIVQNRFGQELTYIELPQE
jgi:1,4-alpha-glucan branching enzyme